MKPSVVICCILLVLASLPTRAAQPVYRELRDWVVGCDNTRWCEGRGLPETAGAALDMRVQRAPGPRGAVTVRLLLPEPLKGREATLDGGTVRLAAADWKEVGDASTGVELVSQRSEVALAFLRQARNAERLTLGTGTETSEVSLSGLAAALLLIDEVQGRVGTVTALGRPGPRPDSAVPPADPKPVLKAARYDGHLSEREIARLTSAMRRQHAKLLKDRECFDLEEGGTFDTAMPLSGAEALVFVECWRGAYQSTSVGFRVARKDPARSELLSVPMPGWAWRGRPKQSSQSEFTNAEYDPRSGTLWHSAKGRGLGDCGESTEWVFDGQRFHVASHAFMGRCGGAPGDWMSLWMSETR